MSRLVVFDTPEQRDMYLAVRSGCEYLQYSPVLGRLNYGDLSDVLAIINSVDDARMIEGMYFNHIIYYRYLADESIKQFLEARATR